MSRGGRKVGFISFFTASVEEKRDDEMQHTAAEDAAVT